MVATGLGGENVILVLVDKTNSQQGVFVSELSFILISSRLAPSSLGTK